MSALIAFFLRLLGLVAGLVIAASVAAAALLAGVLWLAQAAWSRLAGRPRALFPGRFGLRRQPVRVPVRAGLPPRRGPADISDVDPRY